jgi:aconitate hydratase
MQQLNLPLQAIQPDTLKVLKYPLPGRTNNWDFLS